MGKGNDASFVRLKLMSIVGEARIESHMWILETRTSNFEFLASIRTSSP